VRTLVLLIAVSTAILAQKVHTLCQACHSEQVSDFLKHPHAEKALSCDACHGSSAKHREASGGAPPDKVAGPQEVPALCGGCHSAQLKQFQPSKHSQILAAAGRVRAPNCGTCHGVHAKNMAVQMQARCQRCHTQLPAACKVEPAQANTVRCNECHEPHGMTLRARK
jgi:hypothetical protein